MTYYLIRAHYKNGINVIIRTVADTLSDAHDTIRFMQSEDVKHGDADAWRYTVEVVETVKVVEPVEEYPVLERRVQV